MDKKSTNINVSIETKNKLNEVIMHLISLNKTTRKSYNHAINLMCDDYLEILKKELKTKVEDDNDDWFKSIFKQRFIYLYSFVHSESGRIS